MPTKEEIESMLFTEDNLRALEYLWENLKVVNRVLLNMKRADKMQSSKSKTEIAACLGANVRDVEFINMPAFFNDSERDYFTYSLVKEGYATLVSNKHLSFNGKKLEEHYRLSATTMRISGKKITVKPITVKVDYDNLQFIIMPQGMIGYGDDLTEGMWWVCCLKEQIDAVLETVDSLKVKLDPIKNNVVAIGGIFQVIELKEKFPLERVVVTDYIHTELELIASMFKNYDTLIKCGVPFKRGVLFAGPPGTGKTTITTALAKRVVSNGGTVFIFSSTQKISFSQLYKYANRFRPSLVILEDFDIIAQQRDMLGGGVQSDLLNVLEGNMGVDGVITVATTNRVDVLDEAATRQGRIDKIYALDAPDIEMKHSLIDLHLQYYKIDIPLDDALKALESFIQRDITGAAISSVLLSARQKAVIEHRDVEVNDLSWAAEGVRKTNGKLGF